MLGFNKSRRDVCLSRSLIVWKLNICQRLEGFAPHVLDRCFWPYSTGDWILKKHSVGKPKDLFLLSLSLLPTRPPHLLLELLQILQMGFLAFHHIYTHLSLPHSKCIFLKLRSYLLNSLFLNKDLQIMNSLFLPAIFFLLLFSLRWSFLIFLNVNIFWTYKYRNIKVLLHEVLQNLHAHKIGNCMMKQNTTCMPKALQGPF